jgi:GT2 family glycosyltransferase
MNIAIIMVSYNACDITVKCVMSIFSSEHVKLPLNVIVVDNSDSIEYFKKLKDKLNNLDIGENDSIELIHVKNNGYFSGINSGLSRLKLDKYEFVVAGNNDLEYQSRFFVELVSDQYPSEAYVLAPNIINLDECNENPRCINSISIYKKIVYSFYYRSYWLAIAMSRFNSFFSKKGCKNQNQNRQYIYLSMGACYVFTKNFLIKTNKLDDRVFLFGEEVLLANQINLLGGKLLYIPNIVVKHCEHSSVGKLGDRRYYDIQKKSYQMYKKYL